MRIKLPPRLQPYSGVIYFIIILLVSHFFWKFTVLGEDDDTMVTFFGLNISAPFIFMAKHVAEVSHSVLNWLGLHNTLNAENVLRYDVSRNAVRIVWSCTGIKQAYIFFCIIAFYRGPWKHKLWYIPLGIILVHWFNLFRIVLITAIVNKHPQAFDLWHEHITKYAFYALIFVMWVIWEEKFANRSVGKAQSQL